MEEVGDRGSDEVNAEVTAQNHVSFYRGCLFLIAKGRPIGTNTRADRDDRPNKNEKISCRAGLPD